MWRHVLVKATSDVGTFEMMPGKLEQLLGNNHAALTNMLDKQLLRQAVKFDVRKVTSASVHAIGVEDDRT